MDQIFQADDDFQKECSNFLHSSIIVFVQHVYTAAYSCLLGYAYVDYLPHFIESNDPIFHEHQLEDYEHENEEVQITTKQQNIIKHNISVLLCA